jgi:hypothetical protein
MSRIDGEDAAVLAELADRPRGRRRVAIEPDRHGSDAARHGATAALGAVDESVDRGLNGRAVVVYGPPINTFREGRDFTRTWRVATDRGTFDVAYSVDRTPEARTHTVLVSRVGDGADDGRDGNGDGGGTDNGSGTDGASGGDP